MNTLTEFTKGGGAARYFVGLHGGGLPVLRVRGAATEGGKPFSASKRGGAASPPTPGWTGCS